MAVIPNNGVERIVEPIMPGRNRSMYVRCRRPGTEVDRTFTTGAAFAILSTPLFGMTAICAEYRSRRYFKLLATTKLSKAEWLAAKVVFHIVLLFASVALMVLTGIVIFGLKAVVTPMAILIIIAGTLEFTSLGMVLGIFVL